MANRAPTTQLISTLLATALLLNSVAASGLTACCCRAIPASGNCCCSRTESKSASSRTCCRKAVESRESRVQSESRNQNTALDSRKTIERHSCCKGGLSGHRESRCASSDCFCRCRHDVPAPSPAGPVEKNRSAEKLAIDLAANLSVATVFQLSAPGQSGDASAESGAVTALDRCACLCRFPL